MTLQKGSLDMLKSMELQIHRDLKKIDDIKERAANDKTGEEQKLFKNTIRMLKSAFREEISQEEQREQERILEAIQARRKLDDLNSRKKIMGKAGVFRSDKPAVKVKAKKEVIPQEQIDFIRFIGEIAG